MDRYNLSPIATVHSPFKEKFGTPRQPGLIPSARGFVELHPPFSVAEAVRGLEQFSHLWLIYIFDRCLDSGWHPTVRPPRLGGNERIGVFASRSNFRPNPLGQSVVKLDGIEHNRGNTRLHISNFDLLDGTPVLDIKPYIRYADSVPDADSSYADASPESLKEIRYQPAVQEKLMQWKSTGLTPPLKLIEELLLSDPRPAYQKGKAPLRQYGVEIAGFELRFHFEGDCVIVDDLVPVRSDPR